MKYTYYIILCYIGLCFAACSKNNTDIKPQVVIITDSIPNDTINNSSSKFSTVATLFPFASESSGIVESEGFIWTHNDGGNAHEIYKLSPIDGTLLQTVTISNYYNIDWEDITADDDYIYIGDFGNNDGNRKDLKVLKVDKSQFINSNALRIDVTAEAINFSYSEQTSFLSSNTHNFDCESVISIGDFLYLFTKNRGDSKTRLYKLSKSPGSYTITSISTYDVEGLVTGADYNLNTNEIALIGYKSKHKDSFLYFLSNFNDSAFFSGSIEKFIIGNNTDDWQTEGIAFSTEDDNEFYISCEITLFATSTLYSAKRDSLIH